MELSTKEKMKARAIDNIVNIFTQNPDKHFSTLELAQIALCSRVTVCRLVAQLKNEGRIYQANGRGKEMLYYMPNVVAANGGWAFKGAFRDSFVAAFFGQYGVAK